ncbi:MAG TPA: glycosyltransferase family 87 protein [Acidimicrobiales bacterium]|nr:glycosyltransferase family 87 protein [Acidimicrobiales bacterium]
MPSSGPEAAGRPASCGFAVAAVAATALAVVFARSQPLRNAKWELLVPLAAWGVTWAVAVLCALRLPKRVAVPAVFAVAVALRLAALAGPPVTSDDLYRYAWDGRVQSAAVDPYRYEPANDRLASLREGWLWPDAAGCARLQRDPGCTRINRAGVHTIYQPVAEAWFTVVYKVSGIGARHKAWQVAGLLGDVALIAVLPSVLRAWGRDERWTALYALSPVTVVEVVNNCHVDGLAALFVVLALLAVARRRPGWAGALIGLATLVKLYPALLGLALLMAAGPKARAWIVRVTGAAVGVVVVAYLPHVAVVGRDVIGYLPGYLQEEHYTEGARYLLASVLGLSPGPTGVVAFAGLVAVAAWVVVRRPLAPRAAAALMGGLLLAVTPVQPWYAVTLVAVATVAAAPAWAAIAVAGYPYFFAVILDSPRAVLIGRASYGLALATVAVAALLRSRRPPAEVTV